MSKSKMRRQPFGNRSLAAGRGAVDCDNRSGMRRHKGFIKIPYAKNQCKLFGGLTSSRYSRSDGGCKRSKPAGILNRLFVKMVGEGFLGGPRAPRSRYGMLGIHR